MMETVGTRSADCAGPDPAPMIAALARWILAHRGSCHISRVPGPAGSPDYFRASLVGSGWPGEGEGQTVGSAVRSALLAWYMHNGGSNARDPNRSSDC